MAQAPRLEWWTAADAAVVRSIAGDWEICAGPGVDVLRVRSATDRPDRLPGASHEPRPVDDIDALWRLASGPARVETLHGDRVVAATTIDAAGDLSNRAVADATPELLALHADAVAAFLSSRAAGVAQVLAGHADAALLPALHAWFSARCPEV